MLWLWRRALAALGVDPRGFAALTRAFVLMDLRGQHYARATATRPHYLLSPLFLVVGQCLTLSALASLLLFARVDVFFYAFAGLSLSMLVLATTVLVEFQEIVLDPRDLDTIGHRPVSPRTYAAARFANLLFYFGLMYLALNLFPLILGAGLRDAGPWYAPAYLLASLAGNLVVLAGVVLLLSLGATSSRLDGLKEVLAWTQIVLIMVVFYGGQLMLKDGTHAIQIWGAFPPEWVRYLPPTWLAHFAEEAATAPGLRTAWAALLLAGVALAAVALTVARLAWLYRDMQPVLRSGERRPMPAERVGGLGGWAGWLTSASEERVGYWMCRTFLLRDTGLAMRCLLAFNLAIAAAGLGLLTEQFGNPCREHEPARILAPVLTVYLIVLAVPAVVYNLSFCRDSGGAWLLAGAPLAGPGGVARGACKAVMVWLVTPLCLLFALAALLAWGDVAAALLHAALAWALAWPAALAGLWLVAQAPPFALPPARGSALGLPPLPMAGLSAVAFSMAAVHAALAWSPAFWLGAGAVCVGGSWWLGRKADARLARLGGPA
jgi:hypothetical protein